MAQLILAGPFVQVPEVLYYRRDHEGRASRGHTTRQVAATLDPRRSDRLRHPLIRLYIEYVAGFFGAVRRAPLSPLERLRCTYEIAVWFVGRLRPARARALLTHGGRHAGTDRLRAACQMSRPRPLRLGAFGFFGVGNLGNEGSLAAVLEHVRSLDAEVDIRCFAGDPEVVRREHGIAASGLMSHRSRPGADGRVEQARKAASRLVDVIRIWRLVGQVDVVVVPGMGVLEPALDDAHAWGFPYWQFLAALSARLRGRAFVLLSVGAGVPQNRWVRLYFRSTLRLARYSTFRDRGSRTAANMIGGRSRPGSVSADLALGLQEPPGQEQPRRRADRLRSDETRCPHGERRGRLGLCRAGVPSDPAPPRPRTLRASGRR